MLRNGKENPNNLMICFCFFVKKTYHDFILIINKFYISHGQVNSIVWKQGGAYLFSTVIP